MNNPRIPQSLHTKSSPDSKFADFQSKGKNRMEHSSISTSPSFWITIRAFCRTSTMQNPWFQSLLFTVGVQKRLAPCQDSWVPKCMCVCAHTHAHPFSPELGKLFADTISGIRIFAFKGINLAQDPAPGISLVPLFHFFLMSFEVEK